jgi:hypothetical protein
VKRVLPALLLVPALAALEVDLDRFPAATVHPDGALFSATLELPAGQHRVRLPAWAGAGLEVRGAASWSLEPAPPAGVDDAVLAPLLAERDRLVRERALLVAEDQRLRRDRQRIAERLAVQAERGEGDSAAWQASLDAWLAARAAQAAAEDRRRAALSTLVAHAAQALGDRAAALRALDPEGDGWPRPAAQARAALGPAPGAQPRAWLAIACGQAGVVTVEHRRSDLRWRPQARIEVGGTRAELVRQVHVSKPAAADFGQPRVTVATAVLVQPMQSPAPGSLRIQGQELERKTSKGLGSLTRSAASMAESTKAGVGDDERVPGQEEPAGRESATLGPAALSLDLGALALPAGSADIGHDLGRVALAVEGDELALLPDQAPVAWRRLALRLDGNPLLPGQLELVVDGGLPARQSVAWQPPGALLVLNAGEDARVCVGDSSAWQVDPAANTPERRRQGRDHWLFASGPAPVAVVVYATLPVSLSDRVQVTADPATTPGYTLVEPGVLRWQVTIPPGQPQRIGVGCRIETSGGFRLP